MSGVGGLKGQREILNFSYDLQDCEALRLVLLNTFPKAVALGGMREFAVNMEPHERARVLLKSLKRFAGKDALVLQVLRTLAPSTIANCSAPDMVMCLLGAMFVRHFRDMQPKEEKAKWARAEQLLAKLAGLETEVAKWGVPDTILSSEFLQVTSKVSVVSLCEIFYF
jgi:hypothetical protein